jgi:hypothetical protein
MPMGQSSACGPHQPLQAFERLRRLANPAHERRCLHSLHKAADADTPSSEYNKARNCCCEIGQRTQTTCHQGKGTLVVRVGPAAS